jgi:hypothetical protein
MIPKVKFILPDAEYEVMILEIFASLRSGYSSWQKILFKWNPGLEDSLKGTKTKQQRLDAIWKKYVRQALVDTKKKRAAQRALFQKEWNKINNDFMKSAEKVIETKWWLKTVDAKVSLCTINPRNIATSSFGVWYQSNSSRMIKTVMHECIHFLYFRKFKEVFPDISEDTYNGHNSLVWALSEIMVAPILNQPEIRQFLESDAEGYRQFQKFKLSNGKIMVEHFEQLFNRNRKKGLSFADNIKSCYSDAEKYRDEIKQIAQQK